MWKTPRYAAVGEILRLYVPGVEPCFEKGVHGKPRLAAEHGWLRFNVSHSGDLKLIAVARGSEVGIDVERIRPVPEMRAIARRWLGLDNVADEREFFRAWTRHEAAVKALGTGLSGKAVAFDGVVLDLSVPEGYVAAVAALAPVSRVIQRDWPPTA